MDWMLRTSAWELTELGRDDFPVLTESSSTTEGNKNVDFFPFEQGFGRSGDGRVYKMNEQKGLAREALSPSGASRRARGHNGNNSNTSCLVDGCTSDLTNCRDYHRRHMVCERHSKTPVVVIGGKEQRFCQQCSRFHSLGEFDEVKRSCRKRLDGHNRRRRKPQPESLYLSCGNFLANHQGAKLLQFGSPEAHTSTHSSSLTQANYNNYNQQLHVIVQQSTSSNSTGHVYSGTEINFPFLLDNCNQPVPEVPISQQQVLNAHASKRISGKSRQLVESKAALSLLSTYTTPQTLGACPNHLMMQQDVVHLNQSTGTCLQFDGLAQYSHSQPAQDLHFGTEGWLENEASQLISFSCN